MRLGEWETWVRAAGLVVLAAAWMGAAVGARSGALRRAGRAAGMARRLRAHLVYALGAVPYFAVCALLWRRLPVSPPVAARVVLLVAGSLLGAAGGALYLLGRRELGRMYNVSSSLGCELYAEHTLVTSGPYARCRHPMYAGLFLAALGGLMVYRTWTLVFMILTLPGAVLKARREEQLLDAEFGRDWERYADAVPGWIPHSRIRKEVNHGRQTAAPA